MKMKWVFRGATALIPLSFLRAQNDPDGSVCFADSTCASMCCGSRISECQAAGAKGVGMLCFTGDGCDCESGCCGLDNSGCRAAGATRAGEDCFTEDGCDCMSETCTNNVCALSEVGEMCTRDSDCESECCGSTNNECQAAEAKNDGERCFTQDGCDCQSGICDNGLCAPAPTPSPLCPDGTDNCDDPHMQGLRGQRIDWSGIDGGWYCLVKDERENFHVNVRVNAPLPIEFPHRQLVTAISIISEGHSLGVEVKDPYSIVTGGCPKDISPCLADGGVTITVDGQTVYSLLTPTRDAHVVENIWVSASNLPVECRQFGADKIWARMYEEFLQGRRTLAAETFEEWLLKYDSHAASGWCRKYVEERGLAHVQSNNAAFRILTPAVSVRLNVGVNYQGGGEMDWDGRRLPDLEFWQMDIGFEGLKVEHESLTGLFGETARPVFDDEGLEVVEVHGALRGEVEDYRVSGALDTDFTLAGQE